MSDSTPDASASAFLGYVPDSARYNTDNNFPLESSSIIVSLITLGASVLDIGCGIGAIGSRLVQERGASVTGIEPESARAEMARGRGLNVHELYLDKTSVANFSTYDYVIFADVLEHLPDPGNLLRLTKQLLEPNGKVVISVPNVAHWSVRYDLAFGRFNYDQYGIMDATHLRWFTKQSLRKFVENCGYTVDKMLFTAGATLPVYEKMRWLSRDFRTKVVRSLSQRIPNMFACQFVIVISPKQNDSGKA